MFRNSPTRAHARGLLTFAMVAAVGAACARPEPARPGQATPIYNKETGRLEQLVSDKDGDGKLDTWAFMDGVRLKHIEIDRNGDGKVDRWEFYVAAPGAAVQGGAPTSLTLIDHVDEANGPDERVTRREFFANGIVRRVEEDTDADGRTDKWEQYENGVLARVELDLHGKGVPTQRLTYAANGSVTRVETDPDGDGVFEPVVEPAPVTGTGRGGG